MSRDTERTTLDRVRYLLIGNYGVGNIGDEALRRYICDRFPEHEWLIVSAVPGAGEYARLPLGVRSLLSLRWIRTLMIMKTVDGIVFGGGTLFTDAESIRACFLWGLHACAGFLMKRPLILAFQGVGPFRTRLAETIARWVFLRASYSSVRDRESAKHLHRWGISVRSGECQTGVTKVWKTNTECIQSFDPVLLLIENKKADLRSKNLISIIPRFSTVWSRDKASTMLAGLRQYRADAELRILSMQPAERKERLVLDLLRDAFAASLQNCTSMDDVIDGIAGSAMVVTQRYHGALAALAAGVPFFALYQRRGDKLHQIAELCGMPSSSLEEMNAEFFGHIDWDVALIRMNAARAELLSLARTGENYLRRALSSKRSMH